MKIAINKILLSNSNRKLDSDIIVYDDIYNDVSNESSFLFCSIKEARYWNKRENLNKGYVIAPYFDLGITCFLPAIQNEYVNFNGEFKLVCQLNSDDIGKFCRSNSGDKLWSGQVLDEGLISIIKDKLQPDDLLYLSDYKNFDGCEFRCWVIDEKVIEITTYDRINTKSLILDKYDEVLKYVENINKYWTPDSLFTVDICFFNGSPKIVEYNCFATSGFYNADVNKICNIVKEYYK